ncbi:MAG: YdiU family protein [Maricaulaceae bacterium]
MPLSPTYRPDPKLSQLGEGFADPVAPATFPAPQMRVWDQRAAEAIGLDQLSTRERDRHFVEFAPLPENIEKPVALRYHGHQYRVYNPDIGDGRGFLFAQLRDRDGRLIDLGTKGSGRTPYARTADGRMTLQGGVREVIAARWLRALGLPTCDILALAETGEELTRHDEPPPVRGAVMTRAQHSHLRIGVFQRHAYEERPDRIAALLDHAVEVYFPALADLPVHEQPAAFLEEAVRANAALAAQWMAAGFVHGVLNSDNMTVTGVSFDYGPWRALPVYAPDFTAAYFDEGRLYAYSRQPEAAAWNLTRLAECLTLIASDVRPLETALGRFAPAYEDALDAAVCARLGVASEGRAKDRELTRTLFAFMNDRRPPFEGVFFDAFGGSAARERLAESPRARVYQGEVWEAFVTQLFERAPDRPERLEHAYFRGDEPVTTTIDVVRGVWSAIAAQDDWAPLEALLARIDEMEEATTWSRP